MTDALNLRFWLSTLDPAWLNVATFGLLALEGAGIPGIPGIIPMVAQVAGIDAGHTSLGSALLWGVAGNWTGSVVGYAAGRWGQRFIPQKVMRHLRGEKVTGLLGGYGGPLIVVSRTVGSLRTPVTLIAGTSHYPLQPYVVYSLLGAVLHVGVWQTLLWKFGPAILPLLEKWGRQVVMALLVLGVVALEGRWWQLKRQAQLEDQSAEGERTSTRLG